MLHVIYLCGVPGSGKSTLMQKVIDELGEGKLYKNGTLIYHKFKKTRTIVLGEYASERAFLGTDRLSMSIQPLAIEIIRAWAADPKMNHWTVLGEGDRLGNLSFFKAVTPKVNLKLFIVKADDEVLEDRQRERGNLQSETFLKSKLTKVRNIEETMQNDVTILQNNTKAQLRDNRDLILTGVPFYG